MPGDTASLRRSLSAAFESFTDPSARASGADDLVRIVGQHFQYRVLQTVGTPRVLLLEASDDVAIVWWHQRLELNARGRDFPFWDLLVVDT